MFFLFFRIKVFYLLERLQAPLIYKAKEKYKNQISDKLEIVY